MRMDEVNENRLWHDFCDYTCDKIEIEPLCVVELLVVFIHCHDLILNVRMHGSSNARCWHWK